MGDDGLVVGLLFPPHLDPSALAGRLGAAAGCPVEVRVAGYMDDFEVRAAKAAGEPEPELRAREPRLDPQQAASLADVTAVLALDAPFDLPRLAPRLRWVQAFGAGVGQLIRVLSGTDVALTSAAGVAAPSIAEFVMGRLLEVWKDLRELDRQQDERVWRPRFGRTLVGRTLGIVGLGAIGDEVARRAGAFGMSVLAVRRHAEAPRPAYVDEVVGPDGLHAVLRRSDAVVLSAPATDDTRDLIGRAELAAMPEGAVLVNVARGILVDEDALVDALETGHLGAAVLDVTREEPLGPGSPLWKAPNIYLSPHTAVSMDDYEERLLDLFADNVRRFRAGERLRNLVDPTLGY